MGDARLAEFVIDLGESSKSVDDFEAKLQDGGRGRLLVPGFLGSMRRSRFRLEGLLQATRSATGVSF